MKYLKLFEGFDESKIHEICKQYHIYNYIINKDGSIDVDGDVYLVLQCLDKLPLIFNKVDGFNCSSNHLTTLEGFPKIINSASCADNLLTSFKYLPKDMSYLNIGLNKIISFQFSPKVIRGVFNCSYNNIKSFEYFPNYVKYFWCNGNPIFEVWTLFEDCTKIELLNDFDIFRDEDTDTPAIFIDRLNDFLGMIGKDPVDKIDKYKNI